MKEFKTSDLLEMNVYYLEGEKVYQCFTQQPRRELGGIEIVVKLLEEVKLHKFSFTLISDKEVTNLKSLLRNENTSYFLEYESVHFHYRYGLITEEEFNKFKSKKKREV